MMTSRLALGSLMLVALYAATSVAHTITTGLAAVLP